MAEYVEMLRISFLYVIALATLKVSAAYCNCTHAVLPLYAEQKHILFGDPYMSYSVVQMLPILFTCGPTSITASDGFVSAFIYSQKTPDSFIISVQHSFCLCACTSSFPAGLILVKFDGDFHKNLSRNKNFVTVGRTYWKLYMRT